VAPVLATIEAVFEALAAQVPAAPEELGQTLAEVLALLARVGAQPAADPVAPVLDTLPSALSHSLAQLADERTELLDAAVPVRRGHRFLGAGRRDER
jgi:hypothetical protein